MYARAPALVLALLLAGSASARPVDAQEATDTVAADPSAVDATPLQAPPDARRELDQVATGELQALFARIEELTDVDVVVDGGVATLTGRTLTQEMRGTAVELARSRGDVLYVNDRIEVETSLAARTGAVIDQLRGDALDWLVRTPVLIAALVVVLFFAFVGRLIGALPIIHRAFGTSKIAEQMSRRIARGAVTLLGIVLALQLLDATALVGALLGAAGVAGVAFGFAFRNIAENWLAGVLLSMRRPFELDDEVSIAGNQGRVVRLTHTDTVLMTTSGNHLRMPNAAVYNGMVENFTRNPLRMMSIKLSMPRDTDVEAARGALLGALEGTRTLTDPAPRVLLGEVGDAHLVLDLRAWVDQRQTSFVRVRSSVTRRANNALASAGISGPVTEHVVYDGPEERNPVRVPAEDARTATEGPRTPVEAVEPSTDEDDIAAQVAADRERSGDTNLLG